MNSRIIMMASAIYLIPTGMVFSFMPQELLAILHAPTTEPLPLLLQVGGAAIVGWGIVNWTARGVMIGGIYARPLALGNFVHFVVGALALGKVVATLAFPWPLLVGLVGHAVFAVLFGLLVFGVGRFAPATKTGP